MTTQTKITLCSTTFLLIVATLFFRSSATSEGIPANIAPPSAITFNYQGQLLTSGGNAIDDTVPMTFSLYDMATGGTDCWTESHTGTNVVTVTDGIFTVLLGAITDIPDDCITGDTYLEIMVDAETLSPRESINAFANIIPDSLETSGILQLGKERAEGGEIQLLSGDSGQEWKIDNYYGTFRLHHSGSSFFEVESNGNLFNRGEITSESGVVQALNPNNTDSSTDGVHLSWIDDHARIRVGGNGVGANNGLTIQAVGNRTLLKVKNDGDLEVSGGDIRLGGIEDGINSEVLRSDGNRWLHLLPWGGDNSKWDGVCIGCGRAADLLVRGDLTVSGSCSAASNSTGNTLVAHEAECTAGSITTGAVIEANLQTPEQMRSESIDQFEKGDLLCWDVGSEELALCDTANSPLIIAVANAHGKPIVMGAEPVKVTGVVKAGDFLVASDVPGRAMSTDNPTFGIVIAQALQSADNDSNEDGNNIILAMIGNK